MKGKQKPFIYVCSPYSGDVIRNIQNAQRYCRFALEKGNIPIAPHLYFPQFMDNEDVEERKVAMGFCITLLEKCKAVWVFGEAVSNGMAEEIEEARKIGKPIMWFDQGLHYKEKK